MSISRKLILLVFLLVMSPLLFAQVYPPQTQLVFDQMPTIPKPSYLNPITDPTFGTTVIRVTDQAVFNTHHNGMGISHHYSKDQPWNSDGTLIKMDGWPSAILDAQTYQVVKTVNPLGGPHTWSNTQPNIIYGTNNPTGNKKNCISQLDVTTNTKTDIQCFSQYDYISYGYWEGNMSNDDRYMALQCRKIGGGFEIAVYDFVTNSIIATRSASIYPNNVGMSQSGAFVIIQWDVEGTGPEKGTWAYNRSDLSPIRNLSARGGAHFDYGYDTQGNEVMVGTIDYNRSVVMIRFDNGTKTILLADHLMSYYMHISCRNLSRPGYAYLTEFADPNSQIYKPNYQKIFAVKMDPNASGNALTETYAHVHHSDIDSYQREVFGVPNRDGSIAMFRSDWMGNSNSEVNSYIAFMPGQPCNLSCTATQITAPSCGNNNGSASVSPQGGTSPFSYQWNSNQNGPIGQTSATANGLGSGTYTVVITDSNNCTSSCSVTLSGASNLGCSASETTAPTCGGNNGISTVTVQGGSPPYSYLWNDQQTQTTATANGLPAGTYTVVVTDANNCTTQCSVSLTDPSNLSCSIVETTIPTNGGNNGVATVTATGGTTTTGDPRTDLLANPDRIGYGGAATGGTNYVYVTNFNQLKNALETAGNYVLLDPSVSGQGIGFPQQINAASNTTLDGSLAPDSWLFPDYNAGFSANTSMINYFSRNNCITYSIEMRGNRIVPHDGSHPSANVGAFNIRGATIWFDHVTITDFWGQSIMTAQGGDYLSFSNMKIVNTNNGVWLNYPNDTPRHISLFKSEINAQQNAPYNKGASHLHMWNNYIHGVLYGTSITGFANNTAPGQNGPVRTFSEHNVYSNNSYEAEWGLMSGENWGGPVQIPGYIYSIGAIYTNGTGTRGNVINSTAPWTIPYSYTVLPAVQVQTFVTVNAGKVPVSGSGNYSYLWSDPQGQTTADATGLSAGNYQVTVTDGVGCSTVCSITMTGAPVACTVGIWLEGAYDTNSTQLTNGLQQIGILPSGQPYHVAPWNYNGTEGGGWQQSDYPAGAIDWVLLSLRTSPQPSSEVAKGAALLMEDGTILPASIELNGSSATSFYIVVEHRNHIPAMTPAAIPLINNTLNYDFRTSNSYNAGAGFGQTQLGSQWALFAGEISQSSPVGYEVSGADIILWQAANGNFSTYLPEDVNMDGDVNGMDRILLNQNNGISSAVQK